MTLVVFGGLPGVGKTSLSRRTADRLGATHLRVDTIEVRVVCRDRTEHRRRVEARVADIAGHVVPTWDEVAVLRFDGIVAWLAAG